MMTKDAELLVVAKTYAELRREVEEVLVKGQQRLSGKRALDCLMHMVNKTLEEGEAASVGAGAGDASGVIWAEQ